MFLAEFKVHSREFITYLDVQRGLSVHTVRSYELDLAQLINFWQSLPQTESSTLELKTAINKFFVHLYHQQIQKSSIARKVSCFKSFEKFCLQQGKQLQLQLTRPKLEKKLPIYLSVEEMLHLLDNVSPSDIGSDHPLRDRAILELLYATGIRCSELVGIKIKDVDVREKTIRILGKGDRERLALFGTNAAVKLQEYLGKEREKQKDGDEFLFINNRGGQLSSRAIQRTLTMFRQFLKIKRPVTPHKIRHTFATHLLNQGVDLRIVQELLGHRSLSSTEKYTHVTMQRLSQLCDRFHPINNIIKNTKKDDA